MVDLISHDWPEQKRRGRANERETRQNDENVLDMHTAQEILRTVSPAPIFHALDNLCWCPSKSTTCTRTALADGG